MYYLKKYWLIPVLSFYAFLHIAQIEVFPFYHFAMYSQKMWGKHNFVIYEIQQNDRTLDLSQLNYRRYIYLTNTLKAFEAMQSNEGCHPSSDIITKYYTLLGLEDLSYKMRNIDYCSDQLEDQMQAWLRRFFETDKQISVYKLIYQWPKDGQPVLDKKKQRL